MKDFSKMQKFAHVLKQQEIIHFFTQESLLLCSAFIKHFQFLEGKIFAYNFRKQTHFIFKLNFTKLSFGIIQEF